MTQDSGILEYGAVLHVPMSEEQREIVEQRAALKRQVWEEVDGICECCDVSLGHDLHEVFVTRARVPVKNQLRIHVRGNCALVCRACHNGPATKPEFKARFARRLRRLGYEPFSEEG